MKPDDCRNKTLPTTEAAYEHTLTGYPFGDWQLMRSCHNAQWEIAAQLADMNEMRRLERAYQHRSSAALRPNVVYWLSEIDTAIQDSATLHGGIPARVLTDLREFLHWLFTDTEAHASATDAQTGKP